LDYTIQLDLGPTHCLQLPTDSLLESVHRSQSDVALFTKSSMRRWNEVSDPLLCSILQLAFFL